MTPEDFGEGTPALLHAGEEIEAPGGAGLAELIAEAMREPDFLWGGRPVYRCRTCGDRFERLEDLPAVLQHEAEAHAAPAPIVRESPILGPGGETLMVEETVGKVEE